MYSVLTILAVLFLIPLTLLIEYEPIRSIYQQHSMGMVSSEQCQGWVDAMVSSLLFYIYNEMSFKVLGEVSPVTHALANTMKRIVIILSSVFVFRNTLTETGQLGSALAMLGTFLYSLTRRW
jgi:solute carrier family 35 protein E1